MTIRSANSAQTWDRHKWVSDDKGVQDWVNALVWSILQGPREAVPELSIKDAPSGTVENCGHVILHNQIHGMMCAVYGDKLQGLLGKPIYDMAEAERQRSDLFRQEAYWLVGPKLGDQLIFIDDFAMRSRYSGSSQNGQKALNPRFIQRLSVWTQTLSAREETIATLREGGFKPDPEVQDEYMYIKDVDGVVHRIQVCTKLWNQTKNWASQIEREMWDRALQHGSAPLTLELTDLFLCCTRRFAIDSVAGSALGLLDLVILLERFGEDIDWDRIRHIKNAFNKPDWLWATLVALSVFEKRTSRQLVLQDWARSYLKDPDEFWVDFIESRFNWSNPDTRLIDFPRAFVKASKGT